MENEGATQSGGAIAPSLEPIIETNYGDAVKAINIVTTLLTLSPICPAQQGWWMTEPIRWLQTNLRESDASLAPERFIGQVADFDANVLLMATGGISAFYPSRVEFHYVNPYIPKGHDTFGEVLRAAHARNIRVVARFDFTKTRKYVFDAHPEWFFKAVDGSPAIYNSLYTACVNGGWYQEKMFEILTEALERYAVDGVFFNQAFSNPTADYSGNRLGICHCDNCRRLFLARFHRDLPRESDADYGTFMSEASKMLREKTYKLIKSQRPDAMAILLADGTSREPPTDVIFDESNTALARPLPLWPYASSDNVNRARNTFPSRISISNSVAFVDIAWRFATLPAALHRIRTWQNVANGGAAALYLLSTLDQEDRTAVDAVRPVYHWLKEHQAYFRGQQSAARVLLLGGGSSLGFRRGFRSSLEAYRGMFRLLSEEHIPFSVIDNLNWIGERDADLVIAPGEVPKELEAYVRDGGRLLVTSPIPPPIDLGPQVKLWKNLQGAYFRIRDHEVFPSLRNTDVAYVSGDYLEVAGKSALTFVPPSMFGPPELVGADWKETESPGLIVQDYGKGKVAWVPWDISALYYLQSSEAHAGLLRDVIDSMLPHGRQLKTSAHPLVEMTLMRQGARELVHFINLSGHSDTAYFKPIPMTDISVQVQGAYTAARAVGVGRDLPLSRRGKYAEFTLAALTEYELVELR
jgi:hypothetical protein